MSSEAAREFPGKKMLTINCEQNLRHWQIMYDWPLTGNMVIDYIPLEAPALITLHPCSASSSHLAQMLQMVLQTDQLAHPLPNTPWALSSSLSEERSHPTNPLVLWAPVSVARIHRRWSRCTSPQYYMFGTMTTPTRENGNWPLQPSDLKTTANKCTAVHPCRQFVQKRKHYPLDFTCLFFENTLVYINPLILTSNPFYHYPLILTQFGNPSLGCTMKLWLIRCLQHSSNIFSWLHDYWINASVPNPK